MLSSIWAKQVLRRRAVQARTRNQPSGAQGQLIEPDSPETSCVHTVECHARLRLHPLVKGNGLGALGANSAEDPHEFDEGSRKNEARAVAPEYGRTRPHRTRIRAKFGSHLAALHREARVISILVEV